MANNSVKSKVDVSKLVKRVLPEIKMAGQQMKNEFSEHLANLAVKKMRDIIEQEIYINHVFTGGQEQKVYERTWNVYDAVTIKKLKDGTWSVGLDARKIYARAAGTYTDAWGEHTGWGQHADIYGEPASAMMATFIEEGVNSKIFSYEGIHVFERTTEYINSIASEEFEKFKKRYKPKGIRR